MVDLQAIYSRHAGAFARLRSGSTMERPYLEMAARITPPPGTVLDIGCGSGEPVARYFAELGYIVTGVDVAAPMLERARAAVPGLTTVRMDMRDLAIGRRFNVLVAWDSFFHLTPDEQRAMFPRFAGHTAAGGALIFTSGTVEGGAVGGDMFGDVLYHGSLDTAEYARLLDEHAFDVVQHAVEDPACGGHTVWVARRRSDAV